ncbi:MAG TPA: hypothetical protein VFD82_09770 [Planctomycetota bacterium]|nr:hypothetical protein [Planctomycetota bacterium]
MDVGAFVQENKRWLAGSALGAIVWVIAGAVIASINDPTGVRASTRGAAAQLYDGDALAAARKEGEQLAAERKRLQQELAFVPSAKYVVDGKGVPPEEYLYEVGRALRQSILTEANTREVTVTDKDVKWELPKGPDEIRATVFGLDLMDEASKRLFAAHDAVRAARPEAIGLRSILYLKLGARTAQRPGARPARQGEIDPRDKVAQEQLTFSFQSDEAVLAAFFEACRQPQRTLVIQTWKVDRPTRPGEPCTVTGALQGIIFKDK